MIKKEFIAAIVMKCIFSASIIQLMFVCLLLIPPEGGIPNQHSLALIPYIPEMTAYAALTAILAPMTYTVVKKMLK